MLERNGRESWIAIHCSRFLRPGFFKARFFDFWRWELAADIFAVGIAVCLPWSTSLTWLFIGFWLFALFPILDFVELRGIVKMPAGGLPVLLWLLALLAMVWATDVSWDERWDGLTSLFKLLSIPLLMFQFQRSSRAHWVVVGFLLSSSLLLIFSWIMIFIPGLAVPWERNGGIWVPVKDYITQSGEFAVCIFLFIGRAFKAWRDSQRGFAIALVLIAVLFFANMYSITVSRTGIFVIPALLLLLIMTYCDRRHLAGVLLATAVMVVTAWSFAPVVSDSIQTVLEEIRSFRPEGVGTRAGERLEFWRKSVGFVVDSPLIGHGTGAIRDQFRRAAVGQSGMAAMAPKNPHNQIFAVAIQLGLVGTAVLFAMWLGHLLLFRGDSFTAWAGLVLVTQNIVSSLFNSHLFDFTQGWGYAIGVGVTAGSMLRIRREARAAPGAKPATAGSS